MSTLTSNEVCKITGLTYRQLDYWARTGVVQAEVGAMGSGTRRRWAREQVLALIVLGRVSDALADRWDGRVGKNGAANQVLRRVAECWDRGVLDLGNGVAMIWEVPTWPSI